MSQITFDTSNITEQDLQIMAILSGGETAAPAKATKPAAAAKAAPKAEPVVDEGPSLEDAVARATKMVSEGQTAAVKAALSSVGAKRVSELEADKVQDFLDALDV